MPVAKEVTLTSLSQSSSIALMRGCKLGCLSNMLGFFLVLDRASHSHMLFHTSMGSAQESPGRGHLRLGSRGYSDLFVLEGKGSWLLDKDRFIYISKLVPQLRPQLHTHQFH